MKVAFWNFCALALLIFSNSSAFALAQMAYLDTELGNGRGSAAACMSGKIEEQEINQVRYILNVEQDYDASQNETIAIFEIGVSFVKSQRSLSEAVPNVQLKSELGEEVFKRVCAQYVSKANTGVTVSATMEKIFPGVRKFSGFEAPATPEGLEKFRKAVAALDLIKDGHVHRIFNPSSPLPFQKSELENLETIIQLSGAVNLKPLEEIANEWSANHPSLPDVSGDGGTQYSITPNL